MAHISKEQTVQYILTLIDDTLQVETDPTNNTHGYIKMEILKSLFHHNSNSDKW